MSNSNNPLETVLAALLLGVCLVIIATFTSFGIRYGWLLAGAQFSF